MKTIYLIKNPKENISQVTSICEHFPQKTTLTDGKSYAVDAKSITGAAYAVTEWEIVRLEIEEDIPVLELMLGQKELVKRIF
jgi:hypothetical protein